MDDVDSKDFDSQDFGSEELDEMIVYGDSSAISPDNDKPIPFDDDDMSDTGVSHSPLDLAGGDPAETAEAEATAHPVKPLQKMPAGKMVSSERIMGVKTFFTKLHPGAMDFLDQQINNWLKANPGLVIKRTNIATGKVQGKKTEPNIIITVWY